MPEAGRHSEIVEHLLNDYHAIKPRNINAIRKQSTYKGIQVKRRDKRRILQVADILMNFGGKCDSVKQSSSRRQTQHTRSASILSSAPAPAQPTGSVSDFYCPMTVSDYKESKSKGTISRSASTSAPASAPASASAPAQPIGSVSASDYYCPMPVPDYKKSKKSKYYGTISRSASASAQHT